MALPADPLELSCPALLYDSCIVANRVSKPSDGADSRTRSALSLWADSMEVIIKLHTCLRMLQQLPA